MLILMNCFSGTLLQGGHFSHPVWGHLGLLAVEQNIGEAFIKVLGQHKWDFHSTLVLLPHIANILLVE
jgi:hypothetical protein